MGGGIWNGCTGSDISDTAMGTSIVERTPGDGGRRGYVQIRADAIHGKREEIGNFVENERRAVGVVHRELCQEIRILTPVPVRERCLSANIYDENLGGIEEPNSHRRPA